MSEAKIYTYNVEIIFCSDDFDIEEQFYNGDVQADTTEELAQLLKADWDRWRLVLQNGSDERYLKYDNLSIVVWDVVRNSDGASSEDDETIPYGGVVTIDLHTILDGD